MFLEESPWENNAGRMEKGFSVEIVGLFLSVGWFVCFHFACLIPLHPSAAGARTFEPQTAGEF
jgi:hypothetical protein